MNYDYLIVGAGFFGATFARCMADAGKRCLVIEKRNHPGGNAYTRNIDGIDVHVYGAHIFHTSDFRVWEFINGFSPFNRFTNSPVANYKGEIYNLPFNMNTFNRLWGVVTPDEARNKIESQRAREIMTPCNLEEQALQLAGTDIYEKLIRGYTQKQWGRDCKDLPATIIRRIPLRFTYDNNYFNDRYQGIPIDGYTRIFEKLLKNIDVQFNTDYLAQKDALRQLAYKVVFTGPIDAYFDYTYGPLSYRSLQFKTQTLPIPNYQGCAVVNYTDANIPWTRIIEHKHFTFGTQESTVITHEYPEEWNQGMEPFYPINDIPSQDLYERYRALALQEENVIFGGRLGEYCYYNMDEVVLKALEAVETELFYEH